MVIDNLGGVERQVIRGPITHHNCWSVEQKVARWSYNPLAPNMHSFTVFDGASVACSVLVERTASLMGGLGRRLIKDVL